MLHAHAVITGYGRESETGKKERGGDFPMFAPAMESGREKEEEGTAPNDHFRLQREEM